MSPTAAQPARSPLYMRAVVQRRCCSRHYTDAPSPRRRPPPALSDDHLPYRWCDRRTRLLLRAQACSDEPGQQPAHTMVYVLFAQRKRERVEAKSAAYNRQDLHHARVIERYSATSDAPRHDAYICARWTPTAHHLPPHGERGSGRRGDAAAAMRSRRRSLEFRPYATPARGAMARREA